jgi:hypothetical protein
MITCTFKTFSIQPYTRHCFCCTRHCFCCTRHCFYRLRRDAVLHPFHRAMARGIVHEVALRNGPDDQIEGSGEEDTQRKFPIRHPLLTHRVHVLQELSITVLAGFVIAMSLQNTMSCYSHVPKKDNIML